MSLPPRVVSGMENRRERRSLSNNLIHTPSLSVQTRPPSTATRLPEAPAAAPTTARISFTRRSRRPKDAGGTSHTSSAVSMLEDLVFGLRLPFFLFLCHEVRHGNTETEKDMYHSRNEKVVSYSLTVGGKLLPTKY